MPLSITLRGDYDGNGLGDHAVLIEYQTNNPDSAKRFKRVLAVLRHREGVQVISLTDALPFDEHPRIYLRPTPKGSKGVDMNDYREFIYERDAITVVGEACQTFVYRGGRFVSLWTCD